MELADFWEFGEDDAFLVLESRGKVAVKPGEVRIHGEVEVTYVVPLRLPHVCEGISATS